MISLFDRAWAKGSRAIDTVYGEPFLFQPMKAASGARPGPDPDRASVEITAAFAETPILIAPIGKRTANNTVLEDAGSFCSIDFADMALPYIARNGDRLLRINTGEIFEITAALPDKIARTVVRVVRLMRPGV